MCYGMICYGKRLCYRKIMCYRKEIKCGLERERERKEEKKERGFCVKEKVERETRLSDELI